MAIVQYQPAVAHFDGAGAPTTEMSVAENGAKAVVDLDLANEIPADI